MSQSLMRGLSLLEAVGEEPVSISELARRLDIDKATISRLVHSAEAEGWVVRRGGLISLGPRAASIGQRSNARRFEQLAGDLAHTLAGVSGLDVMVHQYAGGRAYLLAYAAGRHPMVTTDVQPKPFPLLSTAVGLSLASQLDDEQLAAAETVKDPTAAVPFDREQARARLEAIREGGVAREDGEYRVGIGCLAMPWKHEWAVPPTAISCLGLAMHVDAVEGVARRALRAAVLPGASPGSIVNAAGLV